MDWGELIMGAAILYTAVMLLWVFYALNNEDGDV